MKCELCGTNESGKKRICLDCIEMVGRLVALDNRMRCKEQCAAERLAACESCQGVAGRG